MTGMLMDAVIVVATVNIVLTVALVATYVRVYARTRAPFTFGLVLFAAAFLGQNALVAYAYGSMMPLLPEVLAPYLLGIGVLEAVGLAAVLWTATR
jgi:hypothetical protein